MRKRHLFWIIPITLLIGGYLGSWIYIEAIATLDDMVTTLDKCSTKANLYAIEQNKDCEILIIGYLKECSDNINTQTSDKQGGE